MARNEGPMLRFAVLPLYLVAALMIVLPLLDTTLSTWPLRFGEVSWRFGAVGLFSRALLTPMLGLTLLLVVALWEARRWMLHTVTVLAGAGTLMLLAALPLFTLDYMQMRSRVQAAAEPVFDVASVLALGKLGIFAAFAIVLAAAGWRSGRRVAAVTRRHSGPASATSQGGVLLRR